MSIYKWPCSDGSWFILYLVFLLVIRYVGRLFVKGSGKPLEIVTKLNELAGFSPDEEIELFEVHFFLIYQFVNPH